MKLSVIIVHWNTPDDLKSQIANLRSSKELEIIVIDNHSDKKIKLPGECVLIQNKSNLGFAKACNQGAKIAKGDWLLFLNPDVTISTKTLSHWIKQAEKADLDASSLEPSTSAYKKPVPSWYSLLIEFSPLHRFFPTTLNSKNFTLTGGCLLIRADVLKKLGGWDERFFLWFEDSDLTKRLLDNANKIGWINLPFKHAGGTSLKQLPEGKRRSIFFSSMNKYAKKHFNLFGRLVVNFLTILNQA